MADGHIDNELLVRSMFSKIQPAPHDGNGTRAVSAADKAEEIDKDMTGMWWQDADEGGLRDAAKVWRDFADGLEKVTAAGTTLATAAIESMTVDLAVAQPMAIGLGESKGLSLDEVQNAGLTGALTGGLLGGGGATYKAINDAGGLSELLGDVRIPGFEPNFALPGGGSTSLDDLGALTRTGQGGGGAMRPPPPYAEPLDALGRAQGVDTTITPSMLNTGQKAPRRIKPPGRLGDTAEHTRGHLLARSLGGDGRARENIVIMYAKANNEVMESSKSGSMTLWMPAIPCSTQHARSMRTRMT
ncbi:DNA/RNA non-specific endonuclease [Streptomyces sp. NPDC086838]|uniref:DNA/RNA non-specific endonuclease n=1 Tax=Streptomyces sp. NPDC086838 TaxID=3365762 RepID=UPI00381428DF